jgi:hypothetical protein
VGMAVLDLLLISENEVMLHCVFGTIEFLDLSIVWYPKVHGNLEAGYFHTQV